MTDELHLQPRLQLLADLVPQGARLADIGTDHGYLPVYLLQKGRICSAIAADIGQAPLQHARNTALQYGIADGLSFRCCDETIIHILSQAPWTKAGSTLLLLQPMTKQEDLRRWLNENGYAQSAERLVRDKDYLYPVFTVFGGEQPPLTIAEIYGGVDIEVDPLAGEYLDQRIRRLSQAEAGLRKSSDQVNAQRAGQLAEIRQSLTERRAEL